MRLLEQKMQNISRHSFIAKTPTLNFTDLNINCDNGICVYKELLSINAY